MLRLLRGHATNAARAISEGEGLVGGGPGERRAKEAGPVTDARRELVRAGWRAPGGWRRQVLTVMIACAAERRDAAHRRLF